MTNKITESKSEKFFIDLLEGLSYQYIYGPDIAPDDNTLKRIVE